MAKIRHPAVAGTFYELDADALKVQIESCFLHHFGPKKIPKVKMGGPREILGLICPHAGYIYSGPVAANAYFSLALDGKPDTVVVLGPNHTGYGSALATVKEGFWRTPFGDVEIDKTVVEDLLKQSGVLDVDDMAHRQEHSIEVQLPFLQYLYDAEFKFVPICFLMQDLESAKEIGKALAATLRNRNALVIASSDFTHYEPQEEVGRKDLAALKAIEALDENKFYSVLENQNISACGYAPIGALITYAKALGAQKGELLSHRTSGDITGDKSSVVGYAAVSFKKQSNM